MTSAAGPAVAEQNHVVVLGVTDDLGKATLGFTDGDHGWHGAHFLSLFLL